MAAVNGTGLNDIRVRKKACWAKHHYQKKNACFEEPSSDNNAMSRPRTISILCASVVGLASFAGGNTYA